MRKRLEHLNLDEKLEYIADWIHFLASQNTDIIFIFIPIICFLIITNIIISFVLYRKLKKLISIS